MSKGTATIPSDGCDWRATRQPVVVDAWPVVPPPADSAYTTLMQWQSYPPVEYAGQWYGTKAASFGPYLDLPQSTSVVLEIALGGRDAPRDTFRENGWRLK